MHTKNERNQSIYPRVEINGARSIKNVFAKQHVKATRKPHQAITCKLRVNPGLQQSSRLSCNRCVQRRFASFEARAKVLSRPAPFICALHFFPRVDIAF